MPRVHDPRRDVVIRPFRPGDEERVLAAFNRVFAAVDPGFVPRSQAAWRWEFADNPCGFEAFVAESAQGEIVGQYAALVQPVLLEGRPATFLHGVDSMTDPAVRGGLSKGGLFARLGNAFLDHHGGPAPGGVPVIWGPPVPAAWRIGRARIGYVLWRTQLKLVLAEGALRGAGAAATAGVEVERARSFDPGVDEAFARAARAHGAIVVRDARRLAWRFLEHPERRYRSFVARRAGAVVGWAVTARASFDGGRDETTLCEWLVPADEPRARAALLGALCEEARADGTARVCTVLPDTCSDWLALQEHGFRARPTRYLMAARLYDERYRERWLHRRFYYTLADTDLV